MATKEQCKKCKKRKNCPILETLHARGVKGDGILRTKCISHKDK